MKLIIRLSDWLHEVADALSDLATAEQRERDLAAARSRILELSLELSAARNPQLLTYSPASVDERQTLRWLDRLNENQAVVPTIDPAKWEKTT